MIEPRLPACRSPSSPPSAPASASSWSWSSSTGRRGSSSAARPRSSRRSGPTGAGEHPKAKHELLESHDRDHHRRLHARWPRPGRPGRHAGRGAGRAPTSGASALMCSGTHPFSDWAEQQISPNPRYAQLVEEMQWLARRLQIFGIHVHVGVRSPEKAIAIANALRRTSRTSSPSRRRARTGWATTPGWRRAAPRCSRACRRPACPYQLSGWDEFEQFMETLISAKAIQSIREVWWDIRPHPDFGTVELRICDGLPTMGEIARRRGPQPVPGRVAGQPDRPGLHAAGAARAGSSARTSGGPPATASTPRSSSTRRAPSGRSGRPSRTWSTSSRRSPAGSDCAAELADVRRMLSRPPVRPAAPDRRQRRAALRDVVDHLVDESGRVSPSSSRPDRTGPGAHAKEPRAARCAICDLHPNLRPPATPS